MQYFLNFAKKYVLSCLSKFKKIILSVFELGDHEVVTKVILDMSHCSYGNLLCHENDNILFTSD